MLAPSIPMTDTALRTTPEESVDPLRETLIGRIRAINPTAGRAFLEQFGSSALALYLEHLNTALDEPRGPGAVWTRPGDTPAITTRLRRD